VAGFTIPPHNPSTALNTRVSQFASVLLGCHSGHGAPKVPSIFLRHSKLRLRYKDWSASREILYASYAKRKYTVERKQEFV